MVDVEAKSFKGFPQTSNDSQECEFSEPNQVTIDHKPRLCKLCQPKYACTCSDFQNCETRWFKLNRNIPNNLPIKEASV